MMCTYFCGIYIIQDLGREWKNHRWFYCCEEDDVGNLSEVIDQSEVILPSLLKFHLFYVSLLTHGIDSHFKILPFWWLMLAKFLFLLFCWGMSSVHSSTHGSGDSVKCCIHRLYLQSS